MKIDICNTCKGNGIIPNFNMTGPLPSTELKCIKCNGMGRVRVINFSVELPFDVSEAERIDYIELEMDIQKQLRFLRNKYHPQS